ncbi:AraC family transcriptional regulator [Marinobacter sp. BW6]|uniref:AraC family transcriptional regulator n=1 Tax=Marinobacter sp. BW6 TaxID=2592624 RepID=UPI0011DE5D6E|nr:AraC family transcriptional regulator [Marinobacter sp. BW6]TYC62493.1 AraC family transcriptional regulator [Marinobacter sp. BW6]
MHQNTHWDTVSRAASRDLVTTCRSLGLISQRQLTALGLNDFESVDPHVRIPESSLVALWQALEEAGKRPGIGLELGQTINPAAKGLLASWVSQASNLREALGIFIKNIELMNPSESWTLTERGGGCTLTFSLDQNKGYPDIAIERSMSAMAAWARALSNHNFPIREAGFIFSEPEYSEPFKSIFCEKLVFNADENYVRFDSALLNLPIVSSSELLKMLIEKQARQSLQALQKSTPIEQKVQAHIRERFASGKAVTISTVCSDLAMSRQTLYRQLKQQGTDFQSLVEAVRKREALVLIKAGSDSSAISLSLGYKDTSSFYKAFKRWFGTTPKAYVAEIK